jgi:stearoyl-CoA desaturase (delta-9 desaturase)
MGWMLAGNGSYKSIDRVTMVKLGKNKILRWQLKHYWSLAIIMNSIIPAIIGYIFGGTMIAAYAGLIFIGLGRAVQQQITFFVNSLCHFVGKQTYIKGTSGDVWWLAVLLLGENWHNFHHAFPSDYRNGAKWYQTDVHKWIIYLMSKCGLAWDLKRTAKVRVDAKISQTTNQITSLHKEKLEAMRSQVEELVVLYQETKLELENSSLVMKSKLNKSFVKIQENLNSLRSQLNVHLRNFDNSSDKILKIISKKVKKADLSMQKIYKEIERLQTFASN